MPAISLTFGDTVKSYPVLENSTSRKVQKRIKDILTKTANEVLRELRIPGKDYNDRTGKLRSSWKKRKLKGYKWRISNRTKYASYIENGTVRIAPRKMLHRALRNARARLRRRLGALAKKVKRGVF
jgi:hypothetical protein